MNSPTATHDPVETVAELLDALDDRKSIAVEADLTVTVAGYTVLLRGYDELVTLDLPSFPAALSLWRALPVEPTDAAAALASVGLTAELQVRGVPVARIGDEAVPSRVARRLGLGPTELLPEGTLLAAVTRRRG